MGAVVGISLANSDNKLLHRRRRSRLSAAEHQRRRRPPLRRRPAVTAPPRRTTAAEVHGSPGQAANAAVVQVKEPALDGRHQGRLHRDHHHQLRGHQGRAVLPRRPRTRSTRSCFLASKGYFNDTPCHRLTTVGHLRPAVRRPDRHRQRRSGLHSSSDENLTGADVRRRRAGDGQQPAPNTNGSQFFIIYKDSHAAARSTPPFGKITQGLDIVSKIAARGAVRRRQGTALRTSRSASCPSPSPRAVAACVLGHHVGSRWLGHDHAVLGASATLRPSATTSAAASSS